MKILVAPLDWGLGHATRCVPLVRRFLAEGHEVVLAGNGRSGLWLKRYFPQLQFLGDIPGYAITYPHHGAVFWHLLRQYRPMRKTLEAEHRWLAGVVAAHGIGQVVSDNRYGLHHPSARCILLTHQLFPVVPFYLRRLVHRQIAHWVNAFDDIWIPDVEDATHNFSGALSHGPFARNVTFIGPLSRFSQPVSPAAPMTDLFASVSGPEPSRSVFEDALLQLSNTLRLSTILTGGIPSDATPQRSTYAVRHSDMSDMAFREAVAGSKLVVCRSGYSTLMDLHALGARALLVPTPGQSEQEYLAGYWSAHWGFSMCRQQDLAAELARHPALQGKP
jgi:hypothetical protein